MTTPTTVQVQIQLRADTAANWTAEDPTLLANEVGLETDTKKLKVGDGTTAWTSLAYFPSIVTGGTVLGNLEIGTTGTLTFEGSTADGFETTLAVTDPTADRTITLPDQTGTVIVSGNASIVNADIAANAEIAVSKLANGTVNQVLVTDGTDVSWSNDLTLAGNLTVNGTTTTVNTETLTVKDKNIELAVVETPTDVTADGGGITLKGATDKTITWSDTTDAWTFNQVVDLPAGTNALPALFFNGDVDTGIYSPGADQLAISTSGTEHLRITSTGELKHIGGGSEASPSVYFAGSAPSNSLYVQATNGSVGLGTSSVQDSSLLTLQESAALGAALALRNRNSTQTWKVAVDATAVDDKKLAFIDAASSAVKMALTDTGLLGIGTTSPTNALHVNSGATGTSTILESTGSGSYLGIKNSSGQWTLGATSTDFILENSVGEALRVDGSRRLLVGTPTSSSSTRFIVEGNAVDGVESFVDLQYGGTNPVSGTGIGRVRFKDRTADQFYAEIGAFADAGTAAGDKPGRLVFSTTPDGGSSPTPRMTITNDGIFRINQTTSNEPAGDNIQGIALGSTGWGSFCRDSATGLFVGRKSGDGVLVSFLQDGTEEGTISVSGTAVSYNGAHLSRWSQLPGNAERTEILRGTVLSNIDQMCIWGEEDNEQLNRMKISDVEGDPNVSGVFQSWDDDDDTYTDDFYCAMTGDFIIRIASGVTVQRGDLLMSAGDGTAKPQDDDIIRSKTIAKVTSTHITCTYDDGSYCVPCVLMAC